MTPRGPPPADPSWLRPPDTAYRRPLFGQLCKPPAPPQTVQPLKSRGFSARSTLHCPRETASSLGNVPRPAAAHLQAPDTAPLGTNQFATDIEGERTPRTGITTLTPPVLHFGGRLEDRERMKV